MVTFLESLALRSFVILLLTWMAIAWYRHRSAAVMHRIWTLGLIGCLLVPIVTLVSPAWELAVLPARVTSAFPSSTQPISSFSRLPGRRSPSQVLPREVSLLQENQQPRGQQTGLTTPANSSIDTGSQSIELEEIGAIDDVPSALMPPLSSIIYWTWVTVAGLLVFHWLLQWIQVKRMLRRCQPLDSKRWQAMRNEVCDLLHVGRHVTLMSCPHATSPMVTGVFRTCLIVPVRARQWADDRVKMVLLHELAHVKRHDLLTQSIASAACAMNWFNPLAWYARRQMQTLREIACDDQVVTHCEQSADYADTLLDVARTYRHRNLAMTVAMARTPKVEGRILAILDSARNRTGLSRSSALLLVAMFGVLVGATGSLQLKAIAQLPAEAVANSNDEKPVATAKDSPTASSPAAAAEHEDDEAAQEEIRKMRIRVLDDKGDPLANATVGRSVWEIKHTGKFPHKEYQTDERGEVDIEMPQQIRILRLWPSKPKYVGQFLNFAQGTHRNGELIPDSYEFRLQPGKRLSGYVVDTNGDPIVGAKVDVSVANNGFRGPEGLNPKPKVNTWIAEDEDAAVTNELGEWEVLNAPTIRKPDDYEFKLLITHAEFAGDTQRGERQKEQGVTTAQLRDGTAKIVLDRGLKIQGTVRGPSGEPITKGLVVWSSEPYLSDGVNEAPIDAMGRYQSLPLSPGKYPVTVIAPGYAPQQIEIKLDPSSSDLDFELEKGNRIELQFVDKAGAPIPKVEVNVGEWRGTNAIYNERHSDVPNSGIPRKADGKGRYIWEWGPEDAVTYQIFGKGFTDREVTLVASTHPHQVVLDPDLKIYGDVTDKTTGEPIDKFSVIPVKAFRPDFYSTDFRATVAAKAGKFEIEIDSYGQTGNRYMVRIEADGYRTAFSTKSMEVGDPPLHEDFALEPAPALTAKVIGPDGNPATKFTVAVGTATIASSFSVDRQDSSFGIAFNNEVGSSEFQLPATFERQIVRVFNDEGFAEIARSPDEPLGTIRLQPWARVSGRLMQGDKSIPNETVYFRPLENRGLTDARFQNSFYTTTDTDGNFQFNRLPPMTGSVSASLGPWRASEMTSAQSIPIDLKPGEHRKLQLGLEGIPVVGKVVAKGRDNSALSKQYSLNYLISRQPGMSLPQGERPLEFASDQNLDAEVLHSDDFGKWLNTKHRYFVKLADDGALQIDGVPPGDYDLVIQLYEEPAGCLVETIGEKIVPVTVTAGTSESKVHDIGTVEVECRTGPRVGSDMRAFKFVDTEGRRRAVNDMEGQFVLFHVWASWCTPCLRTMPNLKATIESHSQSPLAVVGLNIDEDAAKAKKLAMTGDWNWAMNYVGPNSAIARQLAVSSAPAYYLIGPDGKLVMSSSQWSDIQQSLTEALANFSSKR